jgi:hypothetical protein
VPTGLRTHPTPGPPPLRRRRAPFSRDYHNGGHGERSWDGHASKVHSFVRKVGSQYLRPPTSLVAIGEAISAAHVGVGLVGTIRENRL